jgi:CDP-glucose 4,6-dehydratase
MCSIGLAAVADRSTAGAVDPEFWRGRRVFVTGHTGFKGSWLALWLQHLGAHVAGYALPPATTPNLFDEAEVATGMTSIVADVADAARLSAALTDHRPEIVLHLAAQALVRPAYADPVGTFTTNVLGTANLLEAVRACTDVRVVVVVTTDKCYEIRDWPWAYRESDRLGGHDPYSASKACAELVTASYRQSFFADSAAGLSVAVATARAGNVIGGGDWSEDRLVPDIVRALIRDETLVLRYPRAVRPWQHVLDALGGYLVLAQGLWTQPALAGAWNFAPAAEDSLSVEEIVQRLGELLEWSATWAQEQGVILHEASALRLDAAKARLELGWRSRFSLDETLVSVAEWYRGHERGDSARALTQSDLDRYHRLLAA